jgi:hypothetical protein
MKNLYKMFIKFDLPVQESLLNSKQCKRPAYNRHFATQENSWIFITMQRNASIRKVRWKLFGDVSGTLTRVRVQAGRMNRRDG